MAILANQEKLYGIPDVFGKDREMQVQNAMDSLLENQIASMDMDGNIMMAESYHALMDLVCSCEECITIHYQNQGQRQGYLLWKKVGRILLAEAIGGKFLFSWPDRTVVQSVFDALLVDRTYVERGRSVVIPRIVLQKVQRMCLEAQTEEALRVLRQNGAPVAIAWAIAEEYLGKVCSYKLVYMQPGRRDAETVQLACIASAELCLRVSQTVQNLRTCMAFGETDPAGVNQDVQNIARAFLEGWE